MKKAVSKDISRRTFIAGTGAVLLTGLLSKYTLPVEAKEVSYNSNGPLNTNTSDAYNYPIRPGTNGWRKLNNMKEKYHACQIPEDILKEMSTLGLVETVLDYPLLFHYTAYNDMQYGFKVQADNFNGLQELYNRNDAAIEMLTIFIQMEPTAVYEEWTDIQKGAYAASFLNIEMLLMQEAILEKLTAEQCQLLIDIASRNYQQMKAIKELYCILDLKMLSVLIQKVAKRQYADRQYSTTIDTPEHSEVTAMQMEPEDELSSFWISYWDWYYDITHFNATRQRSTTAMYNCHSYAWYNQASNNTIWIYSPNQEIYWEDGSYYEWTGGLFLGLKVNYTGCDHSAIVYSLSPLKFISKWGNAGLYIHEPDDTPYSGDTTYSYYRQ